MPSSSAAPISTLSAPLIAAFGTALKIQRSDLTVCWEYNGQSAFVELCPNGSLRATFIDAAGVDVVLAARASAAYQTQLTYTLSHSSSRRMIRDLVEFFSGVREPKFRFVDICAG